MLEILSTPCHANSNSGAAQKETGVQLLVNHAVMLITQNIPAKQSINFRKRVNKFKITITSPGKHSAHYATVNKQRKIQLIFELLFYEGLLSTLSVIWCSLGSKYLIRCLTTIRLRLTNYFTFIINFEPFYTEQIT